MEIADTIRFRDICKMLEKVTNAPNEAAKLRHLQKYYVGFQKHRERYRLEQQIAQNDENGESSFYCILRCLIPNADSAREPYGLQITALAKVYIKVLQLPADSRDAERLHSRSYAGIRGDYANIVYSVLQPRCKTEPSNMTLKQVHTMLDIIASNDRRDTERELTRLCELASAQEQKWFIRLLLKSMHLSLRQQSVFAMLHPQAKEMYQRCSDLSKVCCLLANNSVGDGDTKPTADSAQLNLNNVIEPFQHIRPMLCEIFPGNIETLMRDDVLYLETKMDGERFQLHYANDRFMYLSRNGKDYTKNFGDSYSSSTGNLTPHLQHLLPIGMQSIILDGEMMVWDTRTQRFRVKGENTDVKHLEPGRTWRPCFVVYDLLYLNGVSWLDRPYVQRTHKLCRLIEEATGILQIMKPQKLGSKEDFGRLFQAALNANEEGVVLKKQNARYNPGARAAGGWYKAKADYINGLTTEFDVLIMGGFYNRTRSFIESFLLGVLRQDGPQQYHIFSVGRVANVMRQRNVLQDSLRDHWHPYASETPPLWYHCEQSAEGRPDVWVDPKQSTILQVKAADLVPSSAFSLVKSLHFPRVQAWRNDKVWNECMTLQEYLGMCQNTSGVLKINKRQLRVEDFTTERKKQKITPAQARILGALVYEHKVDPNEIEKTSDFLNGFSFCILSTKLASSYKIADLKRLVISHGAGTVENPLPTDPKCICVAGDITTRIEVLQKSRRYNIVSMSWLLQSCERQQMQLKPKDMVCMTDVLRQQFHEQYDAYGDSYTESVCVEEMRALLTDINDVEDEASTKDLCNLEAALYRQHSPNYFRNMCGYFYAPTTPRVMLARHTFQWRGGQLCSNAENRQQFSNIQYIFVDTEVLNVTEFTAWLAIACETKQPPVVNIQWIMHSERDKCLLPNGDYLYHTN